MSETNIQAMIDRWTNPATRPKFINGSLAAHLTFDEDDGEPIGVGPICFCAQGDVLNHIGIYDAEALLDLGQDEADRAVANVLGISLFQSILLRVINDSSGGDPQSVLVDFDGMLGPHKDDVKRLAEIAEFASHNRNHFVVADLGWVSQAPLHGMSDKLFAGLREYHTIREDLDEVWYVNEALTCLFHQWRHLASVFQFALVEAITGKADQPYFDWLKGRMAIPLEVAA